jgi:hypothetical protein
MDITKAALAAGIASFEATHGGVPDSFQPLIRHAPGAFAGYGLTRAALERFAAQDER